MSASDPLLEARDLWVSYQPRGGGLRRPRFPVLRGVDLMMERGGAVGLVGESGSGKTTLVLSLLGFQPADSGAILVDGVEVPCGPRAGRSRELRRRFQPVFQESLESLNPRLRVESALLEPAVVHRVDPGLFGTSSVAQIPAALLDLVGLDPSVLPRYPRELSGGERQRVAIARALSVRPEALLLDEPVSALDVSVQAGVLELLSRLRKEMGLAVLLVTHDLGVVQEVCDTVLVLHEGTIVETGSPRSILADPRHAATARLVDAVPRIP